MQSKGQICRVGKGDPVGQREFIHTIFGVAAKLFPGIAQARHSALSVSGICNTT